MARPSGRRRSVLGGLKQLFEGAQLDAWASLWLARLALGAVHGLPARVAHGVGLALGDQRLQRVAVGIGGGRQPARVEVGRRHGTIDINTAYSFGLDDQEFVVSFNTDDPSDFLDLVQELRSTESSAYTESETPIFTCIRSSVERALDALDGESVRAPA